MNITNRVATTNAVIKKLIQGFAQSFILSISDFVKKFICDIFKTYCVIVGRPFYIYRSDKI